MVVQTYGGISIECYVIGVFDDDVVWSAGVPSGASLISSNGEDARSLDIHFSCDPKNPVPSESAIIVKDDGMMNYRIVFPTCYACEKGCPGGDKPGDNPGKGNTFFGTFFIVFIIVFSIYCIGGVFFNIYKNEKKGLEAIPHRDFWGALPGYTKDGIVYSTTTVYSFVKGGASSGNGRDNYQDAEDQKFSGYQNTGDNENISVSSEVVLQNAL